MEDHGGTGAPLLQRVVDAPAGLAVEADEILTLQGLAGNRAVTGLLSAAAAPPVEPAVQRREQVRTSTVAAIEQHGALIDQIAADEGFDPALVRGIIAAESAGKASSGAGTKGYKGLMQSSQHVSHLDPAVSIRAGIRKYREKSARVTAMLKRYGTSFTGLPPRQQIALVMVAYNAGEGSLSRAMGYAAAAGDVTRWNEPEHFQRSILYYGAYSTTVGVSRLVSQQGAEAAATHLAAFEGVTVDVLRDRYANNGKWNAKRLKAALKAHLERDRLRLKREKPDLTVAQFRETYPLLAFSAAVKHDNLRQWYVDRVIVYTEHFAGSPLAGGQELAAGGAAASASVPDVSASPATAPAVSAGPAAAAGAEAATGPETAGGGGGLGWMSGVLGAGLGALNRLGGVLGMPDLTRLAGSAGYDEVGLTNAIFFIAHPELGGRKIKPGEKQLAREWLRIRDEMVRPFLKSVARPPAAADEQPTGGSPTREPAAPEVRDDDTPAPRDTPSDDQQPTEIVEPTTDGGAFVHDAMRSTLERLPPAERARFERIEWGWLDYPGNKSKPVKDMSSDELARYERDKAITRHSSGAYFVGKHQKDAEDLFKALARVRPGGGERRANLGATAVLTKEQFRKNPAALDRYIESQLAFLDGQPRVKKKMMNKHAAAAFASMRAAAEGDGVALSVRSAFRERSTAEKSAANAGNAKAVASFSSHSMGLAMDLNLWTSAMGKTGGQWTETSTGNFNNLLRMLNSPAYKWIYMNGAGFGFFQYRNEPWHWEYNPAGFQERFFEDDPALEPGG